MVLNKARNFQISKQFQITILKIFFCQLKIIFHIIFNLDILDIPSIHNNLKKYYFIDTCRKLNKLLLLPAVIIGVFSLAAHTHILFPIRFGQIMLSNLTKIIPILLHFKDAIQSHKIFRCKVF